jgi:long-chain acyl-CoA synthetase
MVCDAGSGPAAALRSCPPSISSVSPVIQLAASDTRNNMAVAMSSGSPIRPIKFTVLPTVWEPGGDQLTPTMKLRRKQIAEKYAHEIARLYD